MKNTVLVRTCIYTCLLVFGNDTYRIKLCLMSNMHYPYTDTHTLLNLENQSSKENWLKLHVRCVSQNNLKTHTAQQTNR